MSSHMAPSGRQRVSSLEAAPDIHTKYTKGSSRPPRSDYRVCTMGGNRHEGKRGMETIAHKGSSQWLPSLYHILDTTAICCLSSSRAQSETVRCRHHCQHLSLGGQHMRFRLGTDSDLGESAQQRCCRHTQEGLAQV